MLTEEQEDALAARIRDVALACHNIVSEPSMVRPIEFMTAPEQEEAKTALRAELEKRGAVARFDEFCEKRLGWWANRPFLVFQRPGVDPSMTLDPIINGTAAWSVAKRYEKAPWRGGALRPMFGAQQVGPALDLLLDPRLNPEKLLEELRRVKVAYEREQDTVNASAFEGQRANMQAAQLSQRHEAWTARPPMARALIRLATQPGHEANAAMLRALAHAIEEEARHDRRHVETVARAGGIHVPVPLPADDWDQKPLVAPASSATLGALTMTAAATTTDETKAS